MGLKKNKKQIKNKAQCHNKSLRKTEYHKCNDNCFVFHTSKPIEIKKGSTICQSTFSSTFFPTVKVNILFNSLTISDLSKMDKKDYTNDSFANIKTLHKNELCLLVSFKLV